jgi:hypothetical protein
VAPLGLPPSVPTLPQETQMVSSGGRTVHGTMAGIGAGGTCHTQQVVPTTTGGGAALPVSRIATTCCWRLLSPRRPAAPGGTGHTQPVLPAMLVSPTVGLRVTIKEASSSPNKIRLFPIPLDLHC